MTSYDPVFIKADGNLVNNRGYLVKKCSGGTGSGLVSSVNNMTQDLVINAGTGISVTNSNPNITIANTGVTSIVAGSGISVNQGTGAVTITNTGGGSPTYSATNSVTWSDGAGGSAAPTNYAYSISGNDKTVIFATTTLTTHAGGASSSLTTTTAFPSALQPLYGTAAYDCGVAEISSGGSNYLCRVQVQQLSSGAGYAKFTIYFDTFTVPASTVVATTSFKVTYV